MMAALHRSNWDTPSPHYGFEVALRFSRPHTRRRCSTRSSQASVAACARPHKKEQILWNEFTDGDTFLLTSDEARRVRDDQSAQRADRRVEDLALEARAGRI